MLCWGDAALVDSAERAARFVTIRMVDAEGLSCGTYLNGPGGPAFLADWANMTNGLLSLFTATRRTEWMEQAKRLASGMLRLFTDEQGFSMSPKGGEQLIMAPRDTYDGAMPSGTACAVTALQRLYRLTGEDMWREALESVVGVLVPMAESETGVPRASAGGTAGSECAAPAGDHIRGAG